MTMTVILIVIVKIVMITTAIIILVKSVFFSASQYSIDVQIKRENCKSHFRYETAIIEMKLRISELLVNLRSSYSAFFFALFNLVSSSHSLLFIL